MTWNQKISFFAPFKANAQFKFINLLCVKISEQTKLAMVYFLLLFPVQTKWPNKQFDVNQKIDFSPSNAWGHGGMGLMTWNINGAIERTLKQICWRTNLLANVPVPVEHSETLNIGHFTCCLCHVKHLFSNESPQTPTPKIIIIYMENSSNKSCIWMEWSIVCIACG